MHVFFFDYCDDDDGRDPDIDGIDFPDIEAAYIDAYHSVIDMWAEARHEGRDLSRYRLEIKDATGTLVMELPFTEVLKTARQG